MRIRTTGNGSPFHPVLLTWPQSGAYPSGGEYDWVEIDSNSTTLESFMHHPTQSGTVQDHYNGPAIDFSQWHNFAFQWSPSGLTGYVDGQVWFTDAQASAQAPGPMFGTVQLDNFHGSGMADSHMDVDWYRVYAP